MTARFRIFFDMDGVLVDFERYMRKHDLTGDEAKKLPGAYLEMEPIAGALEGIRKVMSIAGQYGGEVWLATKPPTGIPWAYADKVSWVLEHLPELKRRIIITHDKGLLGGEGDYLIDDRPHRANCEEFRGTLVHFGVRDDDELHSGAKIGVGGWVALVPMLHDMMKDRWPRLQDKVVDLAAVREALAEPEPSTDDINAARGLLRLGPIAAATHEEATTFDELVAYGLAQPNSNVFRGMPWSFTFNGMPVTHENDDLYIVGPMHFRRGDLLLTDARGNARVERRPTAIATRPAHGGYPGDARPAEGEHAIGELAQQRMTPLPVKLVHDSTPTGDAA